MGDTFVDSASSGRKTSDMAILSSNRKMPKKYLVASRKSFGGVVLMKNSRITKNVANDAAMFLLKVGALEMVRRLSTVKCPFVWSGIQALQVLCCPPLKWIERWTPFKGLVIGMQMLSRPLLVLSIASAFSDQSHRKNTTSDTDESLGPNNSQESSEQNIESTEDTSVPDEASPSQSSKNWLFQLYTELENQGINLPES